MNIANRFNNPFTLFFIVLGLVLIIFILWPLLGTVFSADYGLLFEDAEIAREVRESILLTFYSGLVATIAGLVFGVPLAYVLARKDFHGKSLIEAIIDVPLVIPHSAAGIALLFAFGQERFLGQFFHILHIDFFGQIAGIVVAMMFVSIPFLVDSAKEGFKSVDPRLENVARTLGASPRQTFFTISLPLARRSVISGSILMWARGISEFGAVLFLVYHPRITPVLILDWFGLYGLPHTLALAGLLILISLFIFIVLRLLVQRGEYK